MVKPTKESTGIMDMVKRDAPGRSEADRFELLSAYLDGEITAVERRQVEEWLVSDPSVKRLYGRLLKLRQGLTTMPIPAAEQSPRKTADEVLARLQRRDKLKWLLGGAALAACAIGTISGLLPGSDSKTLQLAQQQIKPTTDTIKSVISTSPLMVAINNPVIEIPKTAVASPKQPINQFKTPIEGIKSEIN
ncbi:zf-HC2 domain-containing protein [Cronbergia sp. UHCC 0137]|uniref:anti-sigma factor family protein n=1 Tax=Cronbergia sp. UHCC 0137 TaxID=3110239 RepID=UPI002B1F171D|nr:zf-HC2 domain-containing protein [Cronbergia sp. UHCC 0137]MEA5620965.1 zf-HC2 domain-containing protein [Cronbergia sp. UHCC 0137]